MIPCPSCEAPVTRVRSDLGSNLGSAGAGQVAHVAEPCGHALGADDLLRLGRARSAAATAGT